MMKTVLLFAVVGALAAGASLTGQSRAAADLYQEGLHQEEIKGDLQKAIATYEQVLERFRDDRVVAARAQLHLGICYERLGQAKAARSAYETLASAFADHPALVSEARERLAALGGAPPPKTQDRAIVVRRVWNGPDVDLQGKPSRDGRSLTFVSYADGPGSVALRDLTTGQTRVLAPAGASRDGYASEPVLSPDGRQIAYAWTGLAPGPTELRLESMDGSRPRRTVRQPGVWPYNLAWAPDGGRLAAIFVNTGTDTTSYIGIVDATNGSAVRLKSLGWATAELGGFSPDGRSLVYAQPNTSSVNPDGGIFIIATDGSQQRALIQGPARDTSPCWTPDGRGVVFLSDRSGTQDLWLIRVAGGQPLGSPVLLRANVGQVVNMGFSVDGSLFYGVRNQQTDVYVAGLDPRTLDVTSKPSRLSDRFVGRNRLPAWSPDGGSIAFIREDGTGAKSLVVRTLTDGSEQTLPTAFVHQYATRFGPTWFPDSGSLLVNDIDAATRRLSFRAVDVQTGQERPVFDGIWHGIWELVRVSPDGQSLYYTLWQPAANGDQSDLRLMRRDVRTGHETLLYRAESTGIGFFGLSLSPAGDRLAFMLNAEPPVRLLMTIPTEGGEPNILYRGDYTHPMPSKSVWTRDGRYILAVAKDGQDRARVWAFPAEGGEPRKLDLGMPGMGSLDLSPEGDRLVFAGTEGEEEVWTISNLLPDDRAAR